MAYLEHLHHQLAELRAERAGFFDEIHELQDRANDLDAEARATLAALGCREVPL